ncbi:MAG: cyclic pyranopterin monophosphate synthase MoaC [Verrucomicrobiales bacterium]
MPRLSHIDCTGSAQMVDVSGKSRSRREAIAEGLIRLAPATIDLIRGDDIAKGNVLAVARIAGIQAAKRTAELIPLCHPLPLSAIQVDLQLSKDSVRIESRVRTTAETGVEMEALTAVCVAALTIYDMCKAVDKLMTVEAVRLVSKTKERIEGEASKAPTAKAVARRASGLRRAKSQAGRAPQV